MSSNSPTPVPAIPASLRSRPDILGLLGLGFYALFTLLPDSSSLVVSWPWVFVWQVALVLPWLWLLRQGWTQGSLVRLGYGFDYGVGLALLGMVGSTLFADFPQQARWYGWAALCGVAALYAVNGWCAGAQQRLHLLTVQGAISTGFIWVSLTLWVSQTLLPELNRLSQLQAQGLKVSYDFSVLELRNWAPIGHQNYVAGYLVLSLPLLLALSLNAKTLGRWIWGSGFCLGLVDLYTTSSRGGWLGLAFIGASGVLLLGNQQIPRRWRWVSGLGLVAALGSILFANNRLRLLFSLSSSDAGGETAFRLITNATGWTMGLAHPLLGAGPGSVSLLYQKYRPSWAGREAELVYQLHSTPAQIWAELGLWGVALTLALLGWLGFLGFSLWRSSLTTPDRILTWSLLAGLGGYGIVSITDYQLDIVCISGILIVYSASLLSLLRQYLPPRSAVGTIQPFRLTVLCWGIVGLLIAIGLWLAPIHRAWQLSSLGFAALSQKQVEPFKTSLEQAHQLAPWEPYYTYQLGWNLGNLQSNDEQVNRAKLAQSLEFFRRNVQASPNQESGTSSLGWQQLFNRQGSPATQSFMRSTQLLPAKRGAFYSLGQSLLRQNNKDLAVQAFALEIVRDPLFLTSPLLQTAQLRSVYPQIQNAVVSLYQQLLKDHSQPDAFSTYLHQCLGGLYWWQGKLPEAVKEWKTFGSPMSREVLSLAQRAPIVTHPGDSSAGQLILKAWLEPQNRTQWIEKALLQANQSQPNSQEVQTIQAGMERSKSFDQWIKQNAPLRQHPRERAGFGVLSRHIDGPAPLDFFPVVENVVMSQFLPELLPSPSYSPDLDTALQPFRERLWRSVTPAQPAP